MSAASPVAATVVVPTRDRPDQLRACLAALDAQAGADLEVVVVDDASRDAGAVAAVVASSPRARLVRGEGRGPAAARNLGAASAAAPVVCFTDDDCRPEPGWLAALLARFDTGGSEVSEVDAVAGPTLTGVAGNPWSTASQVVTNHLMAASLEPSTGRLGFAPTSNLACRAEVARTLPFDERYPLAAGEDREWCARLREQGGQLVFEPAGRVWHHQDLTATSFWRQQQRYGRGAYRFHARRPAGARLQPMRFYVDLLRAGWRHGPRVGALVVAAQVATATGLVAEALADRHRAAD